MKGRRPPRRERPSAHRTLDLKKLKAYRHRQGLTLAQVQELTGIGRSSLCDFEMGRIVLQLHKIKALVELYDLGCFEILELLRFRVIHPGYIKLFNEACERSGRSSQEALEELIIRFYLENSTVAHHLGK